MNNKKCIAVTAVIAIIVGAGAFYGGTIYEKSSLSKQGLLRSGGAPGGNGQRRGPGQGQGSGFNRDGGPSGENGDFAAGEVISKDDKSVTIKTRDGGSKIIYFSDSTTIGKSVEGSLEDLAMGQQVMVSGKSNSDGTLTAQNIQVRPNVQ